VGNIAGCPFAEYFQEFPSVFQVWIARASPTSPSCVLAIIVMLIPDYLPFPNQFVIEEKVGNYVMDRDIIGI
jgi:hypothetical protein